MAAGNDGGPSEDWSLVVADSVGEHFGCPQFVRNFCDAGVQRIQFCFELDDVRTTVHQFMIRFNRNSHTKLQETSLQFRLNGNVRFGNKRYEEALNLYSKCIMSAPLEDSENCLAIGYANRSATLFHLELYLMCLEDICRTFDANCPMRLHHKLFLRRSQCYFKLQNYKESIAAAEICLTLLEKDPSLTEKRKVEINNQILDLIRIASKIVSKKYEKVHNERVAVLATGQEAVKSMAACLEVKRSSLKGRFLVANEPVKAGDLLFVEEPFASVLLKPFYATHCHNCHGKVSALIPCKQCSQVGFCSLNCRNTAWDVYHHIECGQLELLHTTGLGHLVLRTILMAGLEFLLERKDDLSLLAAQESGQNDDMVPGISKSFPYQGYLAVHALVTNEHCVRPEDHFAYILTGFLLSKLLEPEYNRLAVASKDIVFIGSLMVRHTMQMICNAHAITDLVISDSENVESLVKNETQERIATALYPSASLLNHACEPNVIASFSKNVLMVRAVKDVEVGEEILNCYGPHFKRMPTSKRKSILREQYFFNCNCEHCKSDENESGDTFKLRSFDFQFDMAMQALQENDLCNALHLAKRCLELCYNEVDELVPDDNLNRTRDTAKTFDLIARIHAEKGSYTECAEYLQKSLIYVSRLFGCDSIELANEIVKYVEAAVAAIPEFRVDDTSSIELLQRADNFWQAVWKELNNGIRIFNMNYGRDHKSTRLMCNFRKDLDNAGKFIHMLLTAKKSNLPVQLR